MVPCIYYVVNCQEELKQMPLGQTVQSQGLLVLLVWEGLVSRIWNRCSLACQTLLQWILLQNLAVSQMMQSVLSNPQYMNRVLSIEIYFVWYVWIFVLCTWMFFIFWNLDAKLQPTFAWHGWWESTSGDDTKSRTSTAVNEPWDNSGTWYSQVC